jgi:hypothetical protein
VEVLAFRLDARTFMYAFGEHLEQCGACRALLQGPALRRIAGRYLMEAGAQPEEAAERTASLVCEQIAFLAEEGGEPVDSVKFGRAFGHHILNCARCRALVPGRIAAEHLVHGVLEGER